MERNRDGGDRRKASGDFRVRPRSSPASLLVLMVVVMLGATAAASFLGGGGFSDETPDGRLLGVLREVAEAQEARYAREGRFYGTEEGMGIEVPAGVRLSVVRAESASWAARVAEPAAGLTCSQTGGWSASGPTRTSPECWVEPR